MNGPVAGLGDEFPRFRVRNAAHQILCIPERKADFSRAFAQFRSPENAVVLLKICISKIPILEEIIFYLPQSGAQMVDGSHVEVGKFAFDESQKRGRTGDCCRLQNPRQIVLERFFFENDFEKSYDLPIFIESIGQFWGGVLDSGPVETLRTGVAFLKC